MKEVKKLGFLAEILLTGAAGVGSPAHQHTGWLVMKSVDRGSTDDDFLQGVSDAWLGGNEVKLQ